MSKFKNKTLLIKGSTGSFSNAILILFSAMKNLNRVLFYNGGSKIVFSDQMKE